MIDEETIEDLELSEDDVLDIIQEVTGVDRMEAAFLRAIEGGEIDGDIIVEMTDNVRETIENAPDDDKELGEYLKGQVEAGKISVDDFDYVFQAIIDKRENLTI